MLVQHVVCRATALRQLGLGYPDSDAIGLDQLQQLVRCCSRLESLELNCRVVSAAVNPALAELPETCTRLDLTGPGWHTSSLAQLTRLAVLEWCSSDVVDVQLLKLTALSRLQKLNLGGCRVSPELARAVEALGPPTGCDLYDGYDDDDDDDDQEDGNVRVDLLYFRCGPQVGWRGWVS
jgi:hypothetical protein